MQVDFYHLTHVPLERALPRIAERLVASGARLLIVAQEEDARARIDQLLWTYAPDSFLPHACAGVLDDRIQPVLIAAEPVAGNGARNIALADGRWRPEALAFDRAFHFFTDALIVEARVAWKTLADRDGVARRYWRQNAEGRWEQAG